jgi:hypothetical protein
MIDDPLALWRRNPFFILELSPRASRAEVERAGQKLIGLLELGSAAAARYETPFGPATRDGDTVRQAVAALRNPVERVIHELWAEVSPPCERAEVEDESSRPAWTAAERAIGWSAKWAE